MFIRALRHSPAVALAAILCTAAIPSRIQAQDQPHVVTLDQLQKDAAQPAETRRADEQAVKHFLSSPEAQEGLKAANFDLKKVDKAVGQLSDEDLARLADKSRQAEKDFAAGYLSNRDILLIILLIVVVLVIVLAVR
jgi:hypothetical protein